MQQRLTTVLVVLGLLSACTTESTPEDTARAFWRALKNGKPDSILTLVTKDQSSELSKRLTEEEHPEKDALSEQLSEYVLGEVYTRGFHALVRTHVRLQDRDKVELDDQIEFELLTVLIVEDGQWKINLHRTLEEISSAFEGKEGPVSQGFSAEAWSIKEPR